MFKKKEKHLLDKRLKSTKYSFISRIKNLFKTKNKLNENLIEELEEILISSDLGVDTSLEIIENIEKRKLDFLPNTPQELLDILKEEIKKLISPFNELSKNTVSPYIILVVGVNGVGKTTTIAKLANWYSQREKSVFLGAADTFRSGAIEQLQIWADKIHNCTLIKQRSGSDPAAVAYDTVISAKSKNADVVIIDTAGRLHNKTNLMNELSKIKKAISKALPEAPQEVLLVIDGSTGQNAIEQANAFSITTQINTLAITKLEGTAKGGVLIGISHKLKIPIKYIGVGEKMDDLIIFDSEHFIETFFTF